jgi:undecaprenyl phosphate N,N'-diacetylbacillosamine 1-phosphate transferase
VLYRRYFKRLLDLLLTIMLVVLLSWLLLIIMLAYCVTFQFPVFFRQERIGWRGKYFRIVKFRTLKNIEGTLHERRFFLGDLLRFTSLDELPQLWNIITGEMSLVGPRPLPVAYDLLFSPEQQLRHTVRPGITGWAQVHGESISSWEQKFAYDIAYVQDASLLLDMKIIFKTALLLLSFKRGVNLDERPFAGTGDTSGTTGDLPKR